MLKKGNDVTDLHVGRLADGVEVMGGRSTLTELQIPIVRPWDDTPLRQRIEFYSIVEAGNSEPPKSYTLYPVDITTAGVLAEEFSKNQRHSTLCVRMDTQFKLVAVFTDGKELVR